MTKTPLQSILALGRDIPTPNTHHCMILKWGGALGYLMTEYLGYHLLSAQVDKDQWIRHTYPNLLHIPAPKTQHLKPTAERIRHFVALTATSPKIIIIEEIEKMHHVCANMLLKILEEPPKDTYFLCTTKRYLHVLPTITSRATLMTMPFTQSEIIRAISDHFPQENMGIDDLIRMHTQDDPEAYRNEVQLIQSSAKLVTTESTPLTQAYQALSWHWDSKKKDLTYMHIQDFYRYLEVYIEESLRSGMMRRDLHAIHHAQRVFDALMTYKQHGEMHVHKKAATLRFLIRSRSL